MSKLSPLIPDSGNGVSRVTLVTVADVIAWIHTNKPDVLKAAMKAGGEKEVKKALNDLEKHCELWR